MTDNIFRGKNINGKRWEYGAPIRLSTPYPADQVVLAFQASDAERDETGHYLSGARVIPETVGPFIGWCDKNKTQIFVGDIVLCYNIPYEVRFFPHNAAFGLTRIDRKNGNYTSFDWVYSENELLVIGNIHDNPELLKEGTK